MENNLLGVVSFGGIGPALIYRVFVASPVCEIRGTNALTILRNITLKILKDGLSKNFKDHRAQKPNKLQYNV